MYAQLRLVNARNDPRLLIQGNDLLFELKLKIATAAASPFALNISDCTTGFVVS